MKRVITSLLLLSMGTMSTLGANFPDSNTHGYSREIEYIKNRNIVSGFSDGTYRPDSQITRAELTKIIINSRFSTTEIDNCSESLNFPDVDISNKFLNYICKAKEEGIIIGYSDGTYKPNNNITFAEASKIILKTLDSNIGINSDDLSGYINKLRNEGALPPTISDGNPDRIISRGEVAFLIRTVMEDYDVLAPLPKPTYEVMLKRGETKTITETGLSFRMFNHGIHCNSGGYTFIEVNITKGNQSQRVRLQRSCTGIGSGGVIQGNSTQEADAFGYHFILDKVIERENYQADTFEYYIHLK
jgi:hypothetical protein